MIAGMVCESKVHMRLHDPECANAGARNRTSITEHGVGAQNCAEVRERQVEDMASGLASIEYFGGRS